MSVLNLPSSGRHSVFFQWSPAARGSSELGGVGVTCELFLGFERVRRLIRRESARTKDSVFVCVVVPPHTLHNKTAGLDYYHRTAVKFTQ